MSTIDWRDLAERHERAPELDDAQWLRALAAFDEDPAEREAALDSDPLLMFRDLPEVDISSADIDAMKASVASMRRAHAVEHVPHSDSQKPRRRVSAFATARLIEKRASWPVAALLAVAVTALALTGFDADSLPVPTAVHDVAALHGASTVFHRPVTSPEMQLALASMPLVEDADPTKDLLMQIEDDDLSLLVVDAGFDGAFDGAYEAALEGPFDNPFESGMNDGADFDA